MPRAKRSSLAQKMATAALGTATLGIAWAGQLPALAYGPPPPPPVAPGGYQAVVTSTTVGPAGASIAINIGACRATLAVPAGTFSTQVQLTITAPNLREIGDAGHPGYRAICGIGIGITLNGTIYTGTFGHQLTLTVTGFAIKHGDRVGLWNGTSFSFVPATVDATGVRFSFTGSGEDFALLAPRRGGQYVVPPGAVNTASVNAAARNAATQDTGRSHRIREAVLTSLFLTPAGPSPAGIGVLSPEWLTIISR